MDSWKRRRKYMYVVTLWLMVIPVVSFLLDKTVGGTAVIASAGALTALVGTYVFGAAWDDRHKRDKDG